MNNTANRKKSILLRTAISMLITSAIVVFLILLFIRPTVYLSKESGFPKNEAVKYENGKIRFIVPESADIVNHTLIPIKMNWFTTNRLGSVVSVQPKQGKVLAIDFSNLKHDEIIFEITVKNLFGIKTKYDVIIDYSNYLRVFFEKNHLGDTRKPIVLPYYKLDHEFRHIKEELYKLESFYRFDNEGKKEKYPVSKSLVFSKNEAKGHAFLVNTTNEIIVNYDFVLPGIFKNSAQKTFILERIQRSQKTLKTLNPQDKGLELMFNQAPFYVTEFLGWFYYDEAGNRVNVGIGEEIAIPSWVKTEFKLTARYKYEISNQAADDINKLGYVAISYFDGPERVYFAIIKKGTAVENFKLNKPGYETLGWYTDEALTKAYDFTPGVNVADKNLSLYLKSRRTSTVPHQHKITFITPAYANQLVPVYTMHGDKLDLNYSLPSMVTGYENGQFTELDYWTIVDPVSGKDTGKRFDFNTPITSDLTLKAHMRELKLPTPDRDVKFRIIDSIDGKVVYEKTLTLKDNKIQDQDKAEINAVLAQKLAEKNHLLGKFTFRDWYLNADINKKFNINDTVEPGISELNVFGLYNFEASSDIPDPNNPGQPKPLDPSLIKVTFLSETTSVLSVQTSPKNSIFKGTLPEVSKAGYRFKYWAYFKNNQVAGQFGLNDVLTENTTLYPIFEKDPNTPLPDSTVVATIVNKLLGTKEVRLVKKGELLDLNPQQYTTHLTPYLYEFSRFTNENGTTFNYLTERIFSNKTIYVEHTKVAKDQVNYEIKHVFEGKEGEADRVKTQTKQALVDSLVTVSPQDKLTGYEHGFELETTQSETKQVSSEFTTQFTLKYRRRRFDVNFETNFNNRFDGDVSPSSKQKVKYEGTAVEPTNPTITKPGYKYTFVQWQLKSSMNGEYVKTQAYDFSKPVTGDVDLVAYFKEEKTTSTFQIKHVIEGVDDIQEETRVVTKTAKVGSTFTVTSEHRLPEYDAHFTIDGLNQTKEISADGTTVFTLNYARKLYDVFYAAHRGYLVDSPFINAVHVGDEPEPYKAKYQAKVKKPAYTPGLREDGYSYRFIHWQDESKMNGTYQEITGFDFENDRVNGNMYLLAYFVQTVKKVNYTINHVFEGVDDIAERTETKVYQANTDTEVTVSRDQRLTEFDEHFTVAEQSQTQKIKGDGTTVFTLNYVRKSYTVTYEVNFNGTQFTDVMFGNEPQSQSIKYQGKITKPAVNPTLSRVGYSYTFVQWQEKTAMNGQYKPTAGFNFNDFRVEKDITLVAYFTETANAVNYTINHVIEGTDDGIAEQTITRTYTAIADSSHTVSKAQRLPEYEEHFTVAGQTQTKQIKPDGSTVFTLQYKRKSYTVNYEVNYNGNHFSDVNVENQPQSTQVKYQGKVQKPAVAPKLTKTGYNYTFVQWQEKTAMNGTYSQIQEYDFANTRIVGNTTLVAYFTENAKSVNYTINHVIEGVDDIAQKTEARVHQALADSAVTVSKAQRLPEYEEHFTVEDQSQTQTIKPDGSTVFTLQYKRKSYTVNYEVNYNGNHFSDANVENQPQSTQVKYQGKVQKPAVDPKLTKTGYNYTFVQWQEKTTMNGTYSQIQEYDFANTRVTGNITLVAYFTENAKSVNYTINHVIEGVDDIAQRTDAKVHQALADTQKTISRANRLTEFDEHFTVEDQSQTKNINRDGSTVFTLNYVRKSYTVTYEVNFNGNHFSDVTVGGQPQSLQVKYQGKITKPAVDPTLTKEGYTYNFVQWQEKTAMNGTYSQIAEFNFANTRVTADTTLVAYFTENAKMVNYTINHVFEGVDDIAQRTDAKVHQALADTQKTISRDNRLTEFDEHFTVADQTQTKNINRDGSTVFTLNYVRKSYTVTYEVNYNGNHFKNATEQNKPSSQTVKYQDKVNKPTEDPMLQAPGLMFSFFHWQDKAKMNGTYSNVGRFNFDSERIVKNTTLVAYFSTIQVPVNFTIRHVFEGVDDIAQEVKTTTGRALIGTTKTVNANDKLPGYENGFEVVGPFETKQITGDNTEVFTLNYKRREFTVDFEVNFNGNHFANATETNKPQTQTVKYQGKAKAPTATPMMQAPGLQFSFTHWQDKAKMNGTYSNVGAFNFSSERIVKNTTITAYFSTIQVPVSYTIRHVFEGVDDIAQEVKTSTRYDFIGTNKTVDADYKLPGYEEGFTVVGPFETKKITGENQQVFTLNYKRREFTVTYEVNFNGDHFSEVEVGGQPTAQTVKYQGKVQKPTPNPTLTKEGYNYTFVQWQEKTAMNGNYSQIAEFNFANTRVTGNTTLVAYFTENPKLVNYTINHVFQGVGDIAQRTDARVHQALADSNKTISYANRLTEFDEHFNVDSNYQMTEKIDRHGTTVFTLVYRRKLYDVYYEVQYNDTQFGPELQIHTPVGKYLQVPYQGKAPKPHDPVVSKDGYTYTFVHWQLKEEMNGTYKKVSAYNFNQGVEKNITLVAYFEEKLNKVNYQVTYFLEKQGESSSLNDTYQEVTKTYTAPAFSQVHLQPYQDLDLTKYDADTFDVRNKLHAQLTHENNTVVLKKYYQLKQYQISFTANNPTFGNIPVAPEYQKVTRKVNLSIYHFSANQGYKFIGISLDGNENNLIESFIMPANDVVVTAIFKENKKAITYNIRLENADGTFTTQTKTYYAKVGSVHYTTFENPDTNIYEKWEANKNSLVVSESQVQNLVFIKVTRKKFKVTFNVLNSDVTIQERTRRYGEQIGEIKHYSFRQIDIFKLDGVKKSKLEVETHEVTSNLTVEIKILNDRKANHYPQTEVALSQSSILKEQEYPSLDLILVFNGEVLRTSYTRKVVFDKNEEQYEVIAGKYYKYEPIEFVQIPGNTGYFTKKIIDAVPFSLYQPDKDVQFEGSIFMEQIKNIEYISWMRNLSAPLVSFSDNPMCLDNALKDPQLRPQLRKEPTDYARAIFRQYTGISKFWRGIDFTTLPHGYAQNDLSYLPIYEQSEMMSYWCSVIGKTNQHVDFFKPSYITTDLDTKYSNPNIVRGLVLAKENM